MGEELNFESINLSRRDSTGWGDSKNTALKGYDLDQISKNIDPEIERNYSYFINELVDLVLDGLEITNETSKVAKRDAAGSIGYSDQEFKMRDLLVLRALRSTTRILKDN